jgi:hypothetical protein
VNPPNFCFLCGPCRIKIRQIYLPRTSCLLLIDLQYSLTQSPQTNIARVPLPDPFQFIYQPSCHYSQLLAVRDEHRSKPLKRGVLMAVSVKPCSLVAAYQCCLHLQTRRLDKRADCLIAFAWLNMDLAPCTASDSGEGPRQSINCIIDS